MNINYRSTIPKFLVVKVLELRIRDLAKDAEPRIDVGYMISLNEVAKKEYDEGKLQDYLDKVQQDNEQW